MLIKRIEKGNVIEALYDSSNILASSWNTSTNDLTVTFKRGAQYVYRGVRKTDYTRFELAESQGKELNARLKNIYQFERLDDIDVVALVNEIHAYQKEAMSQAEENLITAMKAFIEGHEGQDSIDLKELDNIEFFINEVKKNSEVAING